MYFNNLIELFANNFEVRCVWEAVNRLLPWITRYLSTLVQKDQWIKNGTGESFQVNLTFNKSENDKIE